MLYNIPLHSFSLNVPAVNSVDPILLIEAAMLVRIIRHVTTTLLKDPRFVRFVFVMAWTVEKMDVMQVHLVLRRHQEVSPTLVYIWDPQIRSMFFHLNWSLDYFWFVFGLMCLELFCLYDLCLVYFPFARSVLIFSEFVYVDRVVILFYLRIS